MEDNEGQLVRGHHLLLLEPPKTAAAAHRLLAEKEVLAPQLILSSGPGAIYSSSKAKSLQVTAQGGEGEAELTDGLGLVSSSALDPSH